MGFEIERIARQAEDYVRRNMGSRAHREAQKRRVQRKVQAFFRRLRRAGLILAVLLTMLIAFSLFVQPIGLLTWLIALPTAMFISLLSLFFPTRGERAPVEADPNGRRALPPLGDLVLRVEDGLIDRRAELPGRALPAADRVIARLSELQPHLAALPADGLLAGEARRLVGQHLPRLVDTYLDLPASARAPGSEASQRFTDSLATVGEELDHLLDQCCRDRHLHFETQSRFIESRYREDKRLKGRP